MSKRYSGKSSKDSSFMKKAKLTLKENIEYVNSIWPMQVASIWYFMRGLDLS